MQKNIITNIDPVELSKNKEEFMRFLYAINSLEEYTLDKQIYIEKIKSDFEKLDQKYISKLSFNYKDRILKLKKAIDHNQKFFNKIISIYKPSLSYYKTLDIDIDELKRYNYIESRYIDNLFSYIIRDWSSSNNPEYKQYDIIINEVLKYLKPTINPKILIPGSGLNRLGFELYKYGFDVEANEYIFLYSIMTDYIFNYSTKNEFYFYPITNDSFTNKLTEESAFKKIIFPDVDINKYKGKMKLNVGDFISLYKNKNNMFDCVITCFFIDTAHNIIEYIEIISNLLKKNGIWINLGPLSYHWFGFPSLSIELPYDKLKEVICNYGFEFINEDIVKSKFCDDEDCLRKEWFKCVFFTVKK